MSAAEPLPANPSAAELAEKLRTTIDEVANRLARTAIAKVGTDSSGREKTVLQYLAFMRLSGVGWNQTTRDRDLSMTAFIDGHYRDLLTQASDHYLNEGVRQTSPIRPEVAFYLDLLTAEKPPQPSLVYGVYETLVDELVGTKTTAVAPQLYANAVANAFFEDAVEAGVLPKNDPSSGWTTLSSFALDIGIELLINKRYGPAAFASRLARATPQKSASTKSGSRKRSGRPGAGNPLEEFLTELEPLQNVLEEIRVSRLIATADIAIDETLVDWTYFPYESGDPASDKSLYGEALKLARRVQAFHGDRTISHRVERVETLRIIAAEMQESAQGSLTFDIGRGTFRGTKAIKNIDGETVQQPDEYLVLRVRRDGELVAMVGVSPITRTNACYVYRPEFDDNRPDDPEGSVFAQQKLLSRRDHSARNLRWRPIDGAPDEVFVMAARALATLRPGVGRDEFGKPGFPSTGDAVTSATKLSEKYRITTRASMEVAGRSTPATDLGNAALDPPTR